MYSGWGTSFLFLPTAPGPHPVVNDQNAVIKDIEHWEEQLKVPTLEGLDWSAAVKQAEEVNRDEYFCACHCSGGPPGNQSWRHILYSLYETGYCPR